jgi:FtsZ-binding cell division protein ZapB
MLTILESDLLEIKNLELEQDRINMSIKLNQTKNKKLKREQREWDSELKNLLSDVKTRLAPEMKQYHKSKISISKRGGGGANAMKTYKKSRNAVKDIIDDNYTFLPKENNDNISAEEQLDIPRKHYRENVQVDGINIQFRLKTSLGKIVNIVVQTQSQNGGAYKKFEYSLESMKNRPNEQCIILFDSTLDTVQSDIAYIQNITKHILHVKIFYNLDSFENYITNV